MQFETDLIIKNRQTMKTNQKTNKGVNMTKADVQALIDAKKRAPCQAA